MHLPVQVLVVQRQLQFVRMETQLQCRGKLPTSHAEVEQSAKQVNLVKQPLAVNVRSRSWRLKNGELKTGKRAGTSSHSRELHARQAPRETLLAHVSEHLFHLSVLAEQVVDFLNRRPRAAGDAFAPAPVDHFVMIPLVPRHGIDDGFHAIDLLFVDLVRRLLQP